MNERIAQEVDLLRSQYSRLEHREEGIWFLLPEYEIREGVWTTNLPDISFQVTTKYPGQKPYGFYVRLPFSLASGEEIKNATPSDDPPFTGAWLKFSWDMPEWQATSDLQSGYNLLNWALSFRKRLDEGA